MGKDAAFFEGYPAGASVRRDAEGPTGYEAVFVFDEKNITEEYIRYYRRQYGVDLSEAVDLSDIARVQVYLNCALLFDYAEQKKHEVLNPRKNAHQPEEYRFGLYPAGGDTAVEMYDGKKVDAVVEMTPLGGGKWGAAVPLLSGGWDYNIRLFDGQGRCDGTYLADPDNMPMQNTASGLYSRSSMVYVPYDAAKCAPYTDRTCELPVEDAAKAGKLEFAAYSPAGEDPRYIAIYVPAGYDAQRKEPYKVLYVSHGMQKERRGCEMRWFHEIPSKNMLDHLGADFIMVTMNNQDFDWDYDKIWDEQVKIFAYMEAHYNVSADPKTRAFAGFSMGGMTTSTLLIRHTGAFGWYGIWNAANVAEIEGITEEKKRELAQADVKIQIAYGDWDWPMGMLDAFSQKLLEAGVPHDLFTVPGSHDWKCFGAILYKSVQDFMFR